jgi:hypothetical protein
MRPMKSESRSACINVEAVSGQHSVAHRVTVGVVDGLEVIQIDHEDAEIVLVAKSQGDGSIPLIPKCAP